MIDYQADKCEFIQEFLEGIPFGFQVFDDPGQMQAAIEAKNGNNKARVVAGYCWPWRGQREPDVKYIVIGAYVRRWNLTVDGSLWIVAPETVSEVGCIHTCQGLEVEYVGVIIGPDLIVKNGIVTTDPTARATKFDKSLNGFSGMKGCYVYATDSKLRDCMRGRTGRVNTTKSVPGGK